VSHLEVSDKKLWPVEHFASQDDIHQLPNSQIAFLRRDANVLFAAATDLDRQTVGRQSGTEIDSIALIVSEGPELFTRVATKRGQVDAPFTLRGSIPSRPAIASLEVAPDAAHPRAARLRFAIHPPQPLSALKPLETAISDPVLLQALPADVTAPCDPDSALRMMASSTIIQPVGRAVVYWESYGFAPSDSVEIAVWVRRTTSQGLARRFGIALNIATDANHPVVTSWGERQAGHGACVIPGRVPIIARSVSVDVSHLMPGDYLIEIAMRRGGQTEPVVGGRPFTVR
jgi:hypothetical protein